MELSHTLVVQKAYISCLLNCPFRTVAASAIRLEAWHPWNVASPADLELVGVVAGHELEGSCHASEAVPMVAELLEFCVIVSSERDFLFLSIHRRLRATHTHTLQQYNTDCILLP